MRPVRAQVRIVAENSQSQNLRARFLNFQGQPLFPLAICAAKVESTSCVYGDGLCETVSEYRPSEKTVVPESGEYNKSPR